MSTPITRLRRWCEPVQEDTPQLPRDRKDRVTVSKSDLMQLLTDYDASTRNELLMQMLAHAWEVKTKFDHESVPVEMKFVIRSTCTMGPHYVAEVADQIREFIEHAPGCQL